MHKQLDHLAQGHGQLWQEVLIDEKEAKAWLEWIQENGKNETIQYIKTALLRNFTVKEKKQGA